MKPVEVERQLVELAGELERGVQIVMERQQKAERLARELDQEKARAFLAAGGTQKERDCQVELATGQLRADMEVARLEFRYAERRLRAVEARLSAWQTVAKSLAAAYLGTTGKGR